jgi:hypothetical protein
MNRTFRNGVAIILMFGGYFGVIAWHVYMSWMVNDVNGPFWGILAFLTPPFSDLIMLGASIYFVGLFTMFVGWLVAAIASTWAASVIYDARSTT